MTEPNKPHEPMSAQERFDLGISRYKEGRFDEAIEAWSNISHDDPETYAQAQFNIGATYNESGKLDQAIEAWSKITRDEDPEIHARAQFTIGNTYINQGKLDQAIKTWSNISHDDNPKAYAQAQLTIGSTYINQGKLDQAIEAWSNISHDDDPKAYARAQLGLGTAYYAQEELDQTIKTWSKITRDEDPEIYAQAQLNIGLIYKDQGKLDQAIKTWSNISHDDNPKAYAQAQLNIGNTYINQGKLDQAIEAWSNIRREEVDSKTYAQAQLNLGVVYDKSGKLDQAIEAWSNITRDDHPEIYAQAQLGLGAAYHAQNKIDQAIEAWLSIRREEVDSETYARAQYNIGNTYRYQGKLDQAIEAWSNISHDDDPETYAQAQFSLGKIYEDKDEIKQAKEAYCNVQGPFYYRAQREYRILECPLEVVEKLRNMAINTDKVRESLQIIPDFESRVAHYSRASTAFTLFGDDKNPSNFRLNTIRGVNDPTEGLVLGKYWDQQGIPETIHTNDTATFISCFTFNHDSLNQFRLYGKEDGREATGVSLVFNEEFFSDQPDVLEFIAGPSTDLSSKSEHIKLHETGKMENDNKKPLIGKSTLYRCIYLDPETGYWTLAQRDKSTFYREHNENEDTDAKEKWKDYYELISEIEGCVETHLFNEENNEEEDVKTHLLNKENNDNNSAGNENNKIKSISQILNSIFTEENNLYNKYDKDEKQKILKAIRFILLPLQYLVKHIAFQEEQECRIMYITQFRDEKIHSNREEQKMYVEYEEPVLSRIDKIWLSPGAAKYQDFFRIRLDQGSGKSKVRISQNPFRNKE